MPVGASYPFADAFGVLVFTEGRRGKIELIHVREEPRKSAYAARLLDEVKRRAASLTVDSPMCTTRASVQLLLQNGFMGDEDLLKCELTTDGAFCGRRSVRITFVWLRNETHSQTLARQEFVAKVFEMHDL